VDRVPILMLKKSDLAKQFELITKQEIKNYQDSHNNVLQSVRDLQEEIRHVHESALENHALLYSQQNQFSIEIENLVNAFKESSEKLERFINDQKSLNEMHTEQIVFAGDSARACSSRQKDLLKWITEVRDCCDELRLKCENNFHATHKNIDDLLIKFRSEISDAKKNILNAPSEASIIKKELEEKIEAHKIDVEGVTKELRIYKHDNLVTQKKIENIYTLIERLKKSEVNP